MELHAEACAEGKDLFQILAITAHCELLGATDQDAIFFRIDSPLNIAFNTQLSIEIFRQEFLFAEGMPDLDGKLSVIQPSLLGQITHRSSKKKCLLIQLAYLDLFADQHLKRLCAVDGHVAHGVKQVISYLLGADEECSSSEAAAHGLLREHRNDVQHRHISNQMDVDHDLSAYLKASVADLTDDCWSHVDHAAERCIILQFP